MPGSAKVAVAVAPLPSSNWPSLSVSQPRAREPPSGSVEVSVKVTGWSSIGESETVNVAVGG